MIFPTLLLLFFLVPLIEIYLLIEIGSLIGAPLTIFCVVFTAILGAFLVRAQGFSTVNRIRSQMNQGEIPAVEMLEGLFLLVAGALLLTPGFFTDAIGFACLTPPLRRLIIRRLLARGAGRAQHPGSPPSGGQKASSTLEGEYRRVDN